MPTINIDLGWPRHRKTKRLIAMAGPQAPFCLVTLWCYAGEAHPVDGVLSEYSPSEIEEFAGWTGKKGKFYQALLDSKYLDEGTLKLHDWEEHEAHLKIYMEKVLKMNKARLDKIALQGVRVDRLQEDHVEALQDALQEVSQDNLQESLHDPPEQSRAEQSSSEQRSREESTPVSRETGGTPSNAGRTAASRSALRAGGQTTTGTARHAPTEQKHTVAGIEYDKRISQLTNYLMDHCKIAGNGSRTAAVIKAYRAVSGRFELVLRDRGEVLTGDELVAAAKVAFQKPQAHTLDGIGRFTTKLTEREEISQVREIVSTARNMVGRQKG